MSNPNLQFEEFLAEQMAMVYSDKINDQVTEYLVLNAHERQAQAIVSALVKAVPRAALLAQKVNAPKARDFLLHGVGQRMQMLVVGCRRMFGVASLKRKTPLSGEETTDLACDLNLIYINIHGTMDNLCWAILHEIAPEEAIKTRFNNVGLFKCLGNIPHVNLLNERIAIHNDWEREFRSRRHPAAHRIPLSVPSQVLTQEEAGQWSFEHGKLWASLAEGYPDQVGAIIDRLTKIGTFIACFRHDLDEGVCPIYPTVPNDLGRMLTIFNEVESFLVSTVNRAP